MKKILSTMLAVAMIASMSVAPVMNGVANDPSGAMVTAYANTDASIAGPSTTISATHGANLSASNTFVITLTAATGTNASGTGVAAAVKFGTTLSQNWITDLPAGLTQTITRGGDTTATITITGTPTAAAQTATAVTIAIPAADLVNGATPGVACKGVAASVTTTNTKIAITAFAGANATVTAHDYTMSKGKANTDSALLTIGTNYALKSGLSQAEVSAWFTDLPADLKFEMTEVAVDGKTVKGKITGTPNATSAKATLTLSIPVADFAVAPTGAITPTGAVTLTVVDGDVGALTVNVDNTAVAAQTDGNYVLTVPQTTNSVVVNATGAGTGATAKVNGATATETIFLGGNTTVVNLEFKAQDGTITNKTLTITKSDKAVLTDIAVDQSTPIIGTDLNAKLTPEGAPIKDNKYKWTVGGTEIKEVTGSKLPVLAAYAGQIIKVEVIGFDATGKEMAAKSIQTSAVTNGTITTTTINEDIAPVSGNKPVTVATAKNTKGATVTWTEKKATDKAFVAMTTPTFVKGVEYQATIKIVPETGYTCALTDATIKGAKTVNAAVDTVTATFAKVPTDGEVIGNVTSYDEILKVVPSYVGKVTVDADTTVVRLNQNILGMNLPVSVKWTADKAIATINNATNAVSFVRPAVGANEATRTVTFTPAVRAAGTGKVIVILAPNADPFTVQIDGKATDTTVEVGKPLTAETDCQTTAKYEWLINGVKVSSSKTYTPKLSDNGKTIYVTVTDKNGVKVSSLQYTIVAEAQKVTITDLSAPRAEATLDKVINTKNQAFTSANVQWFEVDDNNNQIKELTYFVADSGKKYQAVITLTGNNLPKSAKKETYAVSNGKIDFAKSVSNNGTNATIVVDYARLGSNDMSSLKDAIVVAGTYYDKVEEDTKSANVYINRWWINLDSKNYNDAKDALNAFNIVAYNKAVATRDDLTSSSADIKDAKEGLEKAQKALVKYLLKGTKVLDDVSVVSVVADGKEYETTTTKLTVNLSKVTDDLTASDFSVKTGNKDQVIDVLSADHKSGSRTYTLTVEVTSLGANRVEEGTVATVSINRDGYKDSAASFKYHNKQLRRPVVTINKDKATIAQGGKKDQAKDTVKLYYTIDNSDPTIASTLYTGAVTIPKDGMTLRVVAIDLTGNYYESETANYKLEIGKDPEVSYNGSSTNTSGSSTTVTPSNPVTPPASTTVTTAQTTVDTQKAIDAAVAAGAKTAALTYRNVTNLSTDVFAAINNVAAKTPGVAVTVNADTTVGGKIAARMYINPVGAKSINPTIDTVASSAANTQVSKTFAKFFKNDVRVATFAAKGDLGMKVNVAVKFDLTGLNKDSIHVYSYNAETNKYKLITAKAYVDANGYVHVATDRGNSLVITDAPLTAK